MVKVIARFVCSGDEYDGKIGVIVDDSITSGKSSILKDNTGKNRDILFRNGKCYSVFRGMLEIVSIDENAKNLKIPRGV